MPPHKREEPRTRRRFEMMDPKREYLRTWIFLLWRANIAIINSVAFPHVAFTSPPTVQKYFQNNLTMYISKNIIELPYTCMHVHPYVYICVFKNMFKDTAHIALVPFAF